MPAIASRDRLGADRSRHAGEPHYPLLAAAGAHGRSHEVLDAVDDHLPLTVDRYVVVAVVEGDDLYDALHDPLQIPTVVDVCQIVLARMQDQRTLLDRSELGLDEVAELTVLQGGAAGGMGQPRLLLIAAEQRVGEELADALALDAVRIAVGQV